MSRAAEHAPQVEVRSRAELRSWLSDNHTSAAPVWLVTFKKQTDHYLAYGDLIEELLCWGWIDSQSRSVDADRTSVRITPRNPNSAWSAANKPKVERARANGAMTPSGEALIAEAHANGMWKFLDHVERLEVPEDLAKAQGELRSAWEAYPRFVKRGALEWIKTAKTEPTRENRIADVVQNLTKSLRPAPFRS